MDLYEFSFLPEEEKEEIVRTKAVFLASRSAGNFLFDLYQLEGFYIEFFYLTNDHGVVKSRCFRSTEELKPYLGPMQVDLPY